MSTRQQIIASLEDPGSNYPQFLDLIREYTLKNKMIWESHFKDIKLFKIFSSFFNRVSSLSKKYTTTINYQKVDT